MIFSKNKQSTKKTMLLSVILSITLLIGSTGNFAFAQTSQDCSNVSVKASERLMKNPFTMNILKQMELQKCQLSLKSKVQNDNSEKILDEKRLTAKQLLSEELERMNKKYEDNTPRAAFSKFVSKMPEKVHNIYWGMFDFQDSKVKSAQKAMKEVIQNGGSLKDARQAFYDTAAMKQVELIEVTKNLQIKYGLADEQVQSTFDKYGKLPRIDD